MRLGTVDDIPLLLTMSKEAHAESIYRDLPYDQTKIETLFHTGLSGSREEHIVIIEGEKGFIGGGLGQILFSSQTLAIPYLWYVRPQYRGTPTGIRLLEAFEFWGKRVGAELIQVGAPDNAIGPMLKRRGYNFSETEYFKWL